jgi:cation transport protein ChaC
MLRQAAALMELPELIEEATAPGAHRELWVFGYASLMWSPDFPLAASSPALLRGYHRALCIYSHRYRGTPARPGLVMGLRRGGSCWGMAFHVRRRDAREALTALWNREMFNRVYLPRFVPVALRDARRTGPDPAPGRTVRALTFVADPVHEQFACELSLEDTARLVAQGRGERGPNIEYVAQTLEHMRSLGVRDAHLQRTLELALRLREDSDG